MAECRPTRTCSSQIRFYCSLVCCHVYLLGWRYPACRYAQKKDVVQGQGMQQVEKFELGEQDNRSNSKIVAAIVQAACVVPVISIVIQSLAQGL